MNNTVTAKSYWTLVEELGQAMVALPDSNLAGLCYTLSMVYGRDRTSIKNDIILTADRIRNEICL